MENGADIMVYIASDLQYNPAEVAKLIQPILDDKADFVITDRFMNENGWTPRPEYMPAI
jgi:hypothetical protein